MASLSAAQIATLAANAGFTGADLATAVAIAMAESSGNPSIIGDSGNSYGLWQINLPAHPQFRGMALLDPQTNANLAFSVYQAAGNSFSPWTTYKTGAYQAYMPAGQGTPPAAPSPAIDVPAATVDATGDTADLSSGSPPAPAQANILGNLSPAAILLLTAAGIGAFLIFGLFGEND